MAMTREEAAELLAKFNFQIARMSRICIQQLGYNALHVQPLATWGNPTPPPEGEAPQHPNTLLLLSGTNDELGRWWLDLDKGQGYIQATDPELKLLFYKGTPSENPPACPA